ncbi:MAG: prephenate dehydrogenase [Burkholderiaceae bacterium]
MKLALIGVGLIGGSFAAALRAAGRVESVCGFDIDAAASADAVRLGIIDRSADSIATAVAGADLVLIATPVGAMADVLSQIATALSAQTIVTDVGSTKVSVIDAARRALGPAFNKFVAGHPIAGRERNGVVHADRELFRNRLFITTPSEETDSAASDVVESLWRAVGARVERLTAEDHDRVFAAVSHLPHVLAYALVAQIASQDDSDRLFAHAGAGFRDFTRIAAASPTMWRDICLANRAAISAALASDRGQLDQLQRAVDASDAVELERVFEIASRARRRHSPLVDGE